MTAITIITKDIESLSAATAAAARVSDWGAVERYETVRRELIACLSAMAADAGLRAQVVRALEDARLLGDRIGAAVEQSRAVNDEKAGEWMRLDRAGRAYARARSV